MLERTILHAEVVYDGLGTPREDAAVVVQDDGTRRQVIAVESLARARESFPDAGESDAGFALSPAPVNAHTHLDLSGMAFEAGSYDAFVRAVIRHRRDQAHTPHTVSGPLLTRLARLARGERLPMQIHVAETADERTLHGRGEGPLAALLAEFGVAWRGSGASPVGYLESLGVLDAAPTLVHMVHVDDADVRAVQRAGCAVVHCPRSNEALGCGRFPWELYARFGVDVAFGTDSRGSSPSLAVTEEVAFSRTLHGGKANPRALVRAAVKGGYRALGMTPPRFTRGAPADAVFVWPVSTV
ncbi:MAG: amidohydrolase family protein [Deinococcales bacterium]